MRSNRTKGLLTKMLLMVSLLFGVVAFTGLTAEAQHRHGRVFVRPRVYVYPRTFWYPRSFWYNRYYFPPSHATAGQGYSDGKDDGKDDAKHGKGYDPYRHNDYKDAVTSAYVDAYLRGYADGYAQRAG